jgi:hypothetical protein
LVERCVAGYRTLYAGRKLSLQLPLRCRQGRLFSNARLTAGAGAGQAGRQRDVAERSGR